MGPETKVSRATDVIQQAVFQPEVSHTPFPTQARKRYYDGKGHIIMVKAKPLMENVEKRCLWT